MSCWVNRFRCKNLMPTARGEASRTGAAVVELQQRLPQARVLYCSATGASEPRNMAYMVRLGLWGPGTAFQNGFRFFLSSLERRGVGAMELLAMEMKRMGLCGDCPPRLLLRSTTRDGSLRPRGAGTSAAR